MKKMLIALLLMATALVMAAESGKFDFTQSDEYAKNWLQVTGNYYKPLGKVETVKNGVKLTANKKLVFIQSKKKIAAKVGDKIELTLTLDNPGVGLFYLSLFEYGQRGWMTNATTYFYLKKGPQTVTKVIEVKKAKYPVTAVAIAFGPNSGRTAVVSSVAYRFVK